MRRPTPTIADGASLALRRRRRLKFHAAPFIAGRDRRVVKKPLSRLAQLALRRFISQCRSAASEHAQPIGAIVFLLISPTMHAHAAQAAQALRHDSLQLYHWRVVRRRHLQSPTI